MINIVTIGGGTGSFNLLRGLKKYPFNISAIVNTFDSGGSSGLLLDEYGILPPGDIRRCLVALSDEESEPAIRELFSFRFPQGGILGGHNFGNILLTALTQMGSAYPEAISRAAQILNCRGQVYPVSLDQAHLNAELENGEIVEGETNIDIPKHDPFLKINKVFLRPVVGIYGKAKEAILNADIIIFCPGDIYTSIIPNLLVRGVPEAIRQSKAKKVFICNLMTKLGESHGFTASQFVREILFYSGLDKLDYVICNNKQINQKYLDQYAEENKYPVEVDEAVKKYCTELILGDLFSEADVLRHDSDKLARLINKAI